jgi:hypothetical protein
MTPEFLAAVIDTLLPGDDVLPSGAKVDLDSAAYASSHGAVFDTIAARAGGGELFVRAGKSARSAVLITVEWHMPDAFRTLLVAVLSDYYEAPPVLAALGWRGDPPQPTGHVVPGLDGPAADRLERVRQRAKLWRG